MSCKAAVKGNMRLSAQEVDALIGELLKLAMCIRDSHTIAVAFEFQVLEKLPVEETDIRPDVLITEKNSY